MSFSTRSTLSALVISSICLVMSSAEFCLVQSVETRPVRRSFLEPVKTPKNYTCCPNLSCNPPICTRYETVMEKKVKVEIVTAVVTRRKCCPGYNADGDSCLPLCPGGCVHGSCSAPNQCTCSPGYRGHACELYGCPPDTWGVGCQYQCQCRHFGTCHPATGECTCPPGYGGDSCQEVVANSTYTSTVDTSTTSSITTTVASTSTTTSTTTVTTTSTETTSSTTTTTVITTTTIVPTTTSPLITVLTTIKPTIATMISSTEDTDYPIHDKIEAKMKNEDETILIPGDLLIVLLSSILFLLFTIAVILTVVYYRCRIKVMRNKHLSKEMDGNRKAMLNEYVKKKVASKVMTVEIKDYKNDSWDNFEKVNMKNNDEVQIAIEEAMNHEYTPMNPVGHNRPHYNIRTFT